MHKRLIYLIFLAFSMELYSEEYTDKSFVDKLHLLSDKEDETSRTLFEITVKIQKFLYRKLSKIPGDAPKLTLKIEGTPPSTDTFRIIYFKRQELNAMNSFEIMQRITRQLIRRTLISLGAKQDIKVPSWLTAGVVYQYVIGETLSTQEKYPITRYSIINKKFPDLDELLSQEAPNPKNYWLYSIYGERCAVFLRGITPLSKGKKNLLDFLIDRKDLTIIDAFRKFYKDFQKPRLRNLWFKKASHRVCFDIINPYPPEEIRAKVTNLLSVTVARPGNNGFGTMKVPIEEVSDKAEKSVDLNYITLIEKSLLEIALTTSETIRPAVIEFVTSLQFLKRKMNDEFKEQFKSTKKKFLAAIDRQILLNRYLDELEKKHNEVLLDYRRIIMVEELAEVRKNENFSNLVLYINELEKKLASIKIE